MGFVAVVRGIGNVSCGSCIGESRRFSVGCPGEDGNLAADVKCVGRER